MTIASNFDVQADNEEQAWENAPEVDASDFDLANAEFEIDSVELAPSYRENCLNAKKNAFSDFVKNDANDADHILRKAFELIKEGIVNKAVNDNLDSDMTSLDLDDVLSEPESE